MDVSDQGGLLRVRVGSEARVTPVELFFDLVYIIFALTQLYPMSAGCSPPYSNGRIIHPPS